MDESTKAKCHAIIHSAAIGCGAANCTPIPGTGFAADIVAMTAMTMSLASLLGGSIPKEVAKGMVIAEIKKQVLKQPLKTLGKELSKFVPGMGQIVGSAISITMIESVGWSIANELDRKINRKN